MLIKHFIMYYNLNKNWKDSNQYYFDKKGKAYYSIENPKTWSDVVKNNIPLVSEIKVINVFFKNSSNENKKVESKNYLQLEKVPDYEAIIKENKRRKYNRNKSSNKKRLHKDYKNYNNLSFEIVSEGS